MNFIYSYNVYYSDSLEKSTGKNSFFQKFYLFTAYLDRLFSVKYCFLVNVYGMCT